MQKSQLLAEFGACVAEVAHLLRADYLKMPERVKTITLSTLPADGTAGRRLMIDFGYEVPGKSKLVHARLNFSLLNEHAQADVSRAYVVGYVGERGVRSNAWDKVIVVGRREVREFEVATSHDEIAPMHAPHTATAVTMMHEFAERRLGLFKPRRAAKYTFDCSRA